MSQPTGSCTVCDAAISIGPGTQVTEILSCTDCRTRLVVEKIEGEQVTLAQAPAVEEDWGQ